ncbi:MAG: NAD(+) synthase, partial [Firmicutes bacterium]|nr:NAD(+) synthase [Bacillota bacterium]
MPPLSFSGFNIESLKNNEAFLAANLKTVLYMKNAGFKNLVIFSVVLKIKQKIVNAYFFIKEGRILNVSLDKSDNDVINFDKVNVSSIKLFSEKLAVSDTFSFENYNICMHYAKEIKDSSIVIYPLFKKELLEENHYYLQDFSKAKNCTVLCAGNGYFDGSDNCIYSSEKIFIKCGEILDISKTFERREILNADLESKTVNAVQIEQINKKKDVFTLNDLECQKIFNILTYGVATRLKNTKIQTAVIGLSGGSDSVLSLLVLVNAFKVLKLDLKNIRAVTLPGFATSHRTFNNAKILIDNLGVFGENYDIANLVNTHLKDIQNTEENVVYENAQARMRTLILMNLANKYNGIMIGTGDMSETALGF